MILAAGRGERLRPLTDHTPKPLLRAGGKPLIEHLLGALVAAGFIEIVVNLAHLGDQIREHLGDGRPWGAQIRYSDESAEVLETGGGIHRALPLLGDEPFLVVNGDVATDFPFGRLSTQPVDLAHLILIDNPSHNLKGDFRLEEGRLRPNTGTNLTFAGIGVYRPELFSQCQPGRFSLIPLLRKAIVDGQVSGEYFGGFWMDIGTKARLDEFDRRLGTT